MTNGQAILVWHNAGKPEIPIGNGIDVKRVPSFIAHCIEHNIPGDIEKVKGYLAAGVTS